MAIYVGNALLVVRSSYRRQWNFPGGTVRQGETPEEAARRELSEEIGLSASQLKSAGSVCGTYDGRRGHVHFFELRLERPPELRLDNREIVEAQLVLAAELPQFPLTRPVMADLYREQRQDIGGNSSSVDTPTLPGVF